VKIIKAIKYPVTTLCVVAGRIKEGKRKEAKK
jgi:hypothetical protein